MVSLEDFVKSNTDRSEISEDYQGKVDSPIQIWGCRLFWEVVTQSKEVKVESGEKVCAGQEVDVTW